MKNKVFLSMFFIIFITINLISQNDSQTENEYNSKEIIKIFNDLSTLVLKNQKNNKLIYDMILLINQKVKNKELIFVKNKNRIEDIFSGAEFYFISSSGNLKEPGYIKINQYFIDIYKKNPSIVYSALVHEVKHAYDYFTNNELFKISSENILERYLFEMDASRLEAMFVIDILLKNNYTITPFEDVLRDSSINDDLILFSIYFRGIDRNIVYDMYKIINSNMTESEMVEKITNIGNNIINDREKLSSFEDFQKYVYKVQLNTFITFTPQIMYTIYYNNNKIEPKDFILDKYFPKINSMITEMSKIYTSFEAKDYNKDLIYKFRKI